MVYLPSLGGLPAIILSLAVFLELLLILRVSIDERRFRAATSYIFLSYGTFRIAFILLALSGMLSFLSKLLVSLGMRGLGHFGTLIYYVILVVSLMLLLKVLYGKARSSKMTRDQSI